MDSKDEIRRRFTNHKPKEGQGIRMIEVKAKAVDLANAIAEMCPQSREKSLALTKLEECIMWANKSIVTNEDFE